MFTIKLAEAVNSARTLHQIQSVSSVIWKSYAEGILSDEQVQKAQEQLEAAKNEIRSRHTLKQQSVPRSHPRPVKPRSRDKQRSIERRRRIATSGAVPSKLASTFTISELAVLSIVAQEIKRKGSCHLHIDAIAALAGCGRTTVQNALRMAAKQGLVNVRERRRSGIKSLTNVVTIISDEWRSWLKLRNRVQKSEHHEYQIFNYKNYSIPIRTVRVQPPRASEMISIPVTRRVIE